MLIAYFPPPVADSKPNQRAKHGDQYRAENCHMSVNEQIPGDDTDEDAEAFGQRECRVGRQIHAQATFVRGVAPRSRSARCMRGIESTWEGGLAGAAAASETMIIRIDLTADIANFFPLDAAGRRSLVAVARSVLSAFVSFA